MAGGVCKCEVVTNAVESHSVVLTPANPEDACPFSQITIECTREGIKEFRLGGLFEIAVREVIDE